MAGPFKPSMLLCLQHSKMYIFHSSNKPEIRSEIMSIYLYFRDFSPQIKQKVCNNSGRWFHLAHNYTDKTIPLAFKCRLDHLDCPEQSNRWLCALRSTSLFRNWLEWKSNDGRLMIGCNVNSLNHLKMGEAISKRLSLSNAYISITSHF